MALYLGAPLWGQKSWVGSFFPSGTRPAEFLSAYSRRLNAVEGNATFYALPSAETIARWQRETPAGFRFCLKVPRTISHVKRLRDCAAETDLFADRLRQLGERCGPCLLQLPPSFNAARLPDLRAWLARWDRSLRIAVEPRHADFFTIAEAEFDALLCEHGATRCTFDTAPLFSAPPSDRATQDAQRRKPRFPVRLACANGFAFVRYVGHPDVAANREWLAPWARRVAEWLREGNDVFFFTHHPDDTHAPALARMMHEMVAAFVPLPPLGAEAPAGGQISLW